MGAPYQSRGTSALRRSVPENWEPPTKVGAPRRTAGNPAARRDGLANRKTPLRNAGRPRGIAGRLRLLGGSSAGAEEFLAKREVVIAPMTPANRRVSPPLGGAKTFIQETIHKGEHTDERAGTHARERSRKRDTKESTRKKEQT